MLTCRKPIVQRESKNVRQCAVHVMLSQPKPEMARNAVLQSRLLAAETENQLSWRLGYDVACRERLRDAETPEVRAARQMHDHEQHNGHRWEETPQQQEERWARDALCNQETHCARVEQARKNNHNLARFDDANFFQEKLYGKYTHT